MRSLEITGTLGLLLGSWLGLAGTAHAVCNGPQAMVAQLKAHPTAENAGVLGSWYATHHQFECAVETFRAGLKAEPQSAQLHYLTGISLVAIKNIGDAVPELQKAAELDPKVEKPHLVLASLYDQMNEPEKAEHEWRRVLAINPQSEPALEGLTGALMKRQDYASVIQLLGPAPRTEKLTIALSRAFGILNDLDNAAAVLHEALKANPDSVPLQQAMVIVLVKQHKNEEAIKVVRSILEKHPADQEAQVEMFRLLVLTNHLDDAKPLGPKLLAARPKDPEILFLNGMVQRSLGDNVQARKLLEEAVALQPDFANSRYQLGTTLVVLHEWQEAKQQLQKAIELGADVPETHFQLAQALRGLGDTAGATQETRTYQQMQKEGETRLEAKGDVAQGDTALQDGKVNDAVAHYHDAVAAQPKNANYRYKLALALERAGDSAGAKQQLEDAVNLDPKLPGPQNALGYLLSRSGDAEGAVKHFQQAVEAAPGWSEAWINLAAELAVTARFDEARQAVAKALELEPENAQAKELRDQLARDPAAQQKP